MTEELSATGHSVTVLLQQVKGGDEDAAFAIWERYFGRLVALAERRLPDGMGRVTGPEDIASSAFECLLRGAREGRFRQLESRDDLWQILVVIAVRRTCNVIRSSNRRAKGESRLVGNEDDVRNGLVREIDNNPTPESLLMVQEVFEVLMQNLDEQLQAIVRYRLAGYTQSEIATKLGITTRSIQRKMVLIRKMWTSRSNDS